MLLNHELLSAIDHATEEIRDFICTHEYRSLRAQKEQGKLSPDEHRYRRSLAQLCRDHGTLMYELYDGEMRLGLEVALYVDAEVALEATCREYFPYHLLVPREHQKPLLAYIQSAHPIIYQFLMEDQDSSIPTHHIPISATHQ